MNFKETFLKYKQGTANKAETQFIEKELEKNELINEYLADQITNEYSTELTYDVSDEFSPKKIAKQINLKFLYTVLISVLVMTLIAGLTYYVALPMYNNAFYNPNLGYKATSRNTQLYYDLNAFMRLHSPGNIVDYAIAESLGMGKYAIEVSQYNLFTQQRDKLNKTLVRNSFNEVPLNFYKQPYFAVFYDKGPGSHGLVDENGTRYNQLASEIADIQASLAELPNSAYVSAYISFKQDFDMQSFVEMKNDYSSLSFNWVAIRHTTSKNFVQLGFTPLPVGYRVEQDIIPKEQFPCYDFRYKEYPDNAETYSTHFKTLVKYMSTREEFLNAFGNINGLTVSNYERSYKYIEEHGVKSYGVLVSGKVMDIIKYTKADFINSVKIENVKLWNMQ